MTPEEQQWHWGEGNKYAMEVIKALLLLNGGGALALLTFIGNHVPPAASKAAIGNAVGSSLLAFGLGTTFTVALFGLAYLTQLHYGNGSTKAPIWHRWTYILLIAALVSFLFGIWFARATVLASI